MVWVWRMCVWFLNKNVYFYIKIVDWLCFEVKCYIGEFLKLEFKLILVRMSVFDEWYLGYKYLKGLL